MGRGEGGRGRGGGGSGDGALFRHICAADAFTIQLCTQGCCDTVPQDRA